jgi:hypothetical protein
VQSAVTLNPQLIQQAFEEIQQRVDVSHRAGLLGEKPLLTSSLGHETEQGKSFQGATGGSAAASLKRKR